MQITHSHLPYRIRWPQLASEWRHVRTTLMQNKGTYTRIALLDAAFKFQPCFAWNDVKLVGLGLLNIYEIINLTFFDLILTWSSLTHPCQCCHMTLTHVKSQWTVFSIAGATRTRWWCLLWQSSIVRQRVNKLQLHGECCNEAGRWFKTAFCLSGAQADDSKQLSVSVRSIRFRNMAVLSPHR